MHPGTTDVPTGLMVQLLDWVGRQPRTYAEVMEAWRTSCPRLPVWEDAVDLGLVQREGDCVMLTEAGRDWLAARP